MKETGEVRKQLSGPEAAPYIGAARLLLGQLKQRIRSSGLQQLMAVQEYANGVRIVVSSVFGMDKIDISVPRVTSGGKTRDIYTTETKTRFVIVGINEVNVSGYMWEKDTITMLEDTASQGYVLPFCISDDAEVIGGWIRAASGSDPRDARPALYKTKDGEVTLISTEFYAQVRGLSEDGAKAAGFYYEPVNYDETPFSWNASDGFVTLPHAPRYEYYYDSSLEPYVVPPRTFVNGMSKNGKVIVGYGAITSFPVYMALMWKDGASIELGVIPGLNTGIEYPDNSPNWYTGPAQSYATAVNKDGSVIVGYCTWMVMGGFSNYRPHEAFIWKDGSMSGLGYLPGHDRSIARGVSDDGTVVVGESWKSAPFAAEHRTPVMWVDGSPVELAGGPWSQLNAATCVSGSGKFSGGYTSNDESVYWNGDEIIVLTTGEVTAMTVVKKEKKRYIATINDN